MADETLATIAVNIIADDSKLQSEMDNAVNEAKGKGSQVGSSFALGFHSPILNAIGSVRQLQYGLADAADFAQTVSGVKIAAEYERLSVAFTSITGSASQAKSIMNDLARLGAETPFETAPLTGYAQQLLSLGVSAKSVTKDLAALADATAARGGTTESLGTLTSILAGFRVRPRLDVREVAELGRYLDLAKVVGAGTGKSVSGPVQAEQILSGMSGSKAYDAIIRGIQKTYAGAAAGQGGSTLTGLSQNLAEQTQLALKPTGDLLLPILEGLAGSGVRAASAVGRLNEITGGAGGLVLLAGAAYIGFRRFGGSVIDTIRGVNNLTASLAALIQTTRTATVATEQKAVAEETEAVATKSSRFSKFGNAVGPGAFAFDFEDNDAQKERAKRINTAIGRRPGEAGVSAGTDKNTAALNDNTAALQAAAKVIGGAGRTGTAASQIEREYAVYQLTRGTQTGVG